MILSSVRRILKEDLSKAGEIPKWVDAMLAPLNEFIDNVTLALRNNLTLQDNFSGKLLATKFTHDVPLSVNSGAGLNKVIGVIPLACLSQRMDSFGWYRNQDGTIAVTFGFVGGSSSTVDTCTIYILYGVN